MKTTLAEIDSGYTELEKKQLERKALPSEVAKRIQEASRISIAGFPVYDPKLSKRAASNHLKKIKQYATVRAQLVTDLKEDGIQVLASLPVGDWDRICKASKLLQLHPDLNGMVMFDTDGAREAYKTKADALSFSGWPLFALGAAVLAGVPLQSWTAFCAAGGLATVLYIIGEAESDSQARSWFKWLTRDFGTSYEDIHKFVPYGGTDGQPVTLIMPPPPADVAQVLLKFAQSKRFRPDQLHVAATSDAVRFDPPLNSVLNKHNIMKSQQEVAERPDPMPYVVRDGVVAIIAQFGDFAIEKEVLNALIKDEVVEQPY